MKERFAKEVLRTNNRETMSPLTLKDIDYSKEKKSRMNIKYVKNASNDSIFLS